MLAHFIRCAGSRVPLGTPAVVCTTFPSATQQNIQVVCSLLDGATALSPMALSWKYMGGYGGRPFRCIILKRRESIKRKTIDEQRRRLHQQAIAA